MSEQHALVRLIVFVIAAPFCLALFGAWWLTFGYPMLLGKLD